MKKISFAKMSGAGNDFILFDLKFNPLLALTPENVKKLCSRRTGIGADGILVIGDHPGYDFSLVYYNADGSTGTLCGNGSRCAIRYAHLSSRLKNQEAKFISGGVGYRGEIVDVNTVKFFLGEPEDLKMNFKITAFGKQINCFYLNTGSPHVVINIKDIMMMPGEKASFENIDSVPVFQIGREVRYLKDFAPGGTNVNFIEISGEEIKIRTYERGVEDETLACGTGSVASAVIGSLNYGLKPPVSLLTRSGDKLIVGFKAEGNSVSQVSLSGPAEITFTGEFYSDMYF